MSSVVNSTTNKTNIEHFAQKKNNQANKQKTKTHYFFFHIKYVDI